MSVPESGYTFPWEREAMQGAEIPEGLSIYDQMAYISLRTLYHDYYEKRLNRTTASAEKRRIFGAWDKAKSTAEFERKLAFFHARLYKDTEMAKTAVRKDPSPENAIRLCNVLDGLEKYRPEETAP
ncbi:MAG: hypothetical protein HFF31_08945 [Flavonifractor sp.]|jgi:hypothetical protein|nr:hypothetical protein [Flavonifractor sp.]